MADIKSWLSGNKAIDGVQIDWLQPNKAVETMMNTAMPFTSAWEDSKGKVGSKVRSAAFYTYVWQIFDPVGKYDRRLIVGDNSRHASEFAENLYLGRLYFGQQATYPKGRHLKKTGEDIPSAWPYFIDDSGKGYQYSGGELLIETFEQQSGGNEQIQYPLYDENGNPLLDSNGNQMYETYQYEVYGEGQFKTVTEKIPDIYEKQKIGTGTIYQVIADSSSSKNPGVTDVRVYEFGDEIVAMWNDNGEEKMSKVNRDLTVNVDLTGDELVIINPESIKLRSGEFADIIEFADRDGKAQVMAIEELSQQRPCASEPYGPPLDVYDSETKVNASRAVSDPMWEWILKKKFVDGQGQSLGNRPD